MKRWWRELIRLSAKRLRQHDEAVEQRLFVDAHEMRELRVEKIVAIRTSFDAAISETEVNARKDVRPAGSFVELVQSHATKWRHLWSKRSTVDGRISG